MDPLPAPGPTTLSLRTSLAVLGAALALLAFVELALLADRPVAPLWILSLFVVEAALWSATGLLAWSRRPSNRTGLLLVVTGSSYLLAALGNTRPRPLAVLGVLVASLPLALNVHVLLAFPAGRLQGRGVRTVAAAVYAVSVAAPLPRQLFTPGGPISLQDAPGLAALTSPLQACGRLLSLGVAVVLVQRLRALPLRQRRALGPLYAYGAGAIVATSFAAQLQSLFGISDPTRFVLQVVCLAVIPLAFTAVLLRGGFARAGAVEELSTLLSADQAPTQDVLAAVLGDPSLELLHWLPDERVWVDGDGRPRSPATPADRGLVEVSAGQERLGALTYDSLLLPDPDLVRLAARPAGLALEAERLTVELRRSRARLVAAADDERRRLARDLHDGLQVRLVLLALQAGTLAAAASGAEADALQQLRRSVDEAATELRRTVHALVPAALVERGLGPAVEDLVDRMPLPARLDLRTVPADLSPAVVTTAWFVVSEGLTNALKHASASRLDVELGATDGQLVVVVRDDGVGGARLSEGSGLRGLVDRLDVVGGRLHLHSRAGAGTRLSAQIPCLA
ncbi:MAG: sensor histidine kinase [Frankiales bacterium]|nr:sensor histidine kinase [Frankiales bacterium]